MNSKQSAKRSPASRGCQENKGTAQRYLEPAFIQGLRKKAAGYFIGADPKEITEDPLFKAIVYLRRRHENEVKIAEHFPELLDKLLDPEDPEPARLLADVVRQGNIPRLKEAVKFCELFERKTYERSSAHKSGPLPWEFYTAVAALGFFAEGTIPLKKELKKAAWKERAIAELPVMYRVGSNELLPILQEIRAPREMRIDPEPTADEDPETYYGADQDEANDSPSIEAPAGRDSMPEKAKPALARQRDKLIAERIRELEKQYTSETWKSTWARVFKHLGLIDLPRK
jgi:hypothetical protein